MPTYDYRCKACEHTFEAFHAPDEKISKTCPECGKRRVERLIGSGAGIIFKGSGFYETDYRSSEYKAASKKENSDGAPADKPKKKSKSEGESSPKPSSGNAD